MNNDKIEVKGLTIFANHGVFDEEKKLGQKFIIDIALYLDTQKASLSEQLEDTVHYGLLAKEVEEVFLKEKNDLIETCAEKIATYILNTRTLVEKVDVSVHKPWAPINMITEDILIKISRKRNRVYLGLGSNIGDKKAYIEKAIKMLEGQYTKIVKISNYYETKAWGKTDQDDFINVAIEISTLLNPDNLLDKISKIENALGRIRAEKWGPRTIDIDILYYNSDCIYTENLVIPHPYIKERLFVLEPLNDIASFFMHPIYHKTNKDMLEELKNK